MAEEHSIIREGVDGDSGNNFEKWLALFAPSTIFGTAMTADLDSSSSEATVSPAPSSSSEYYSARMDRLMQCKSGFGSDLEFEIEASRDHWSELTESSSSCVDQQQDSIQEAVAESNREVFESLRMQWPGRFFRHQGDEEVLGQKIAEGAQAEIFEHGNIWVLKVFTAGSSLQDLQKQWPAGMLQSILTGPNMFLSNYCSGIYYGMLLKNGRFAFCMARCWGDLLKLIDLRMQRNHNKCPPLSKDEAIHYMYDIAKGMEQLHKKNIVHRDLKASNVLVRLRSGPHDGYSNYISVADFECSVGIVGTKFWRAPEILLALRNHYLKPNLFTRESDVYSYAMTCYEILTGRIPFEDRKPNDYGIALNGERPNLPKVQYMQGSPKDDAIHYIYSTLVEGVSGEVLAFQSFGEAHVSRNSSVHKT